MYVSDQKGQKYGRFDLADSIAIPEVELHERDMTFFENKIISIEDMFSENEKITLDTKKLELFLNGVKLKTESKDGVYRIYENSKFIGLRRDKDWLFKKRFDFVIHM